MKRKFVVGLALITVIFAISGVFILQNLKELASTEDLRDKHEKILDQYEDILFEVKSAQTELYRHEAGFSRDIDKLAETALRIEDAISALRAEYSEYSHVKMCNNCHSAKAKIDVLEAKLGHVSDHLKKYEQKMSLIVTVKDDEFAKVLEKEAMKESNEISSFVNDSLLATGRMTRQMDRVQMAALKNAAFSIILAIVVSFLLSICVVVWMVRSIRRPLGRLIGGIEKVASGKYDSKVEVLADDEIGSLARTFNSMTDSLSYANQERDRLMEDLNELNLDLENRVLKATEELRLTHQQVLRSETLSAVGTFASGVAHELATPLSSILSYVQVVRKKAAGNERLLGDLELVEKELMRCTNVLRGMLAFARAPEKERIATEINGILRDIVALVGYQTKYKRIKIKENLASGLPVVTAIPGQLRQVFMNIVINALQSIDGEGELEVETFKTAGGSKVAVRITDSGCGIPEGALGKIFEPFYTSRGAGTGLGLAISYGIVEGHGGNIEVKSEVGKGTTFTVYLPVGNSAVKSVENKKEFTTEAQSDSL